MSTSQSTPSNKPPLLWTNVIIFVGLPLATLILVPLWGIYHGFTWSQFAWAVVVLYLNGMSITGGYHRLWSHNAYKARSALKWFYALWGAGALQNSILVWCSDHRRHHRHVDDNEQDPYSAGRGLWFSHMGWMLRNYKTNEEDFSNVRDLQRDPIVMWQHRHYVAITVVMNILPPLLLGWMLGDIIGTFLIVGMLRLIVNHHVTFFINSLAHFWGTRPYTEENSARDNPVLAFLTYGEGYHNYHHIFQKDYRNGIRWFQWDPTKWMINLCAKLGLASQLHREPTFKIQRAMLAADFARAQRELEHHDANPTLKEKFELEYQQFTDNVNAWKTLQAERYERTRADLGSALEERKAALQYKWENAALRTRFKELEYALKMQRKRLRLLTVQLQSQRLSAA